MNNSRSETKPVSSIAALFFLVLTGCDLFDDGQVGNQIDLPPQAKALAIGLGANNKAREGAEIILSGKDSDGIDSPILTFVWKTSSANSTPIQLKELTANSVSFTAPKVVTETQFSFELLVIDAEGQQATDTVSINVLPARDLNHFLSFDAISEQSFQQYQLSLIPELNQLVDTNNSNYTININVIVNYPDRNAVCDPDGFDTSGKVCLNYTNNKQRVLTEFNQTVTGLWQKDNRQNAVDSPINLALPRLILSQFNQSILDENLSRDLLLDPWKATSAEIEMSFNLVSILNAELALNGANDGAPVNLENNLSLSPRYKQASPLSIKVEEIRNAGKGRIESKASAVAYYKAIDPNDEVDTLNKWLVHAGFAEVNNKGGITLKAEAITGTDTNNTDYAHAIYTNNFDLGFGRDMYLKVSPDGNIYSYVTNYPTLEAGIKKLNPLATVVMEYSPPTQGNTTDEKFVKFYTYIPNENGQQVRATEFDFDGRGQKYMPGVCAACHGGEPKAIDVDLVNYQGNINAAFLPWDLDSFLFSDTDPAILDINEVELDSSNLVYNRANQEEQFRKLNQAVYHTYKASQLVAPTNRRFDTVIDLVGGSNSVAGWYLDTPCSGNGNKQGCLTGTFAGDYVPQAWEQPEHVELYSKVIARHCRGCHIVREGTEEMPYLHQMPTPEVFLADSNISNIKDFVFEKGVMPLARLTMDRFWVGPIANENPSEILWNSLGDVGAAPKPGKPIPKIQIEPINFHSVLKTINQQNYLLTKVGRSIVIDASDSLFSDEFQWSLLDVTNIEGFEFCLNDPQALIANGAKAELTAVIANSASQYYCIQLTATNDVSSTNSEIIFVKVVENRLPVINFASNCGIENQCLSVSELNLDATSSAIVLGADISTEPLDFVDPDCTLDPNKICNNINTLFQVVDTDVIDGLDPLSSLSFELARPLDYGILSNASFTLEELLAGNLSYTTNQDEVGSNALTEILEFNLYDNNQLVSDLTLLAEINIDPVSDNSPVFGNINNVVVNFSATTNPSLFEVSDSDQDIITLTTVATPLGSVQTSELSSVAEVTNYQYLFSAKSATEIAGSGSICTNFAVFNGGNVGSFQFRADDGSGGPGIPVSKNVSVTLTPSLNYANVVAAYAAKMATNGSCSSCHTSGGIGNPSWASLLTGLRSLVNLSAPSTSKIFNNSSSGHTGGTYTVDFVNNSADRNLLEWIYQCGPE